MSEVEQATAAPGEKRNLKEVTVIRCPGCGREFVPTISDERRKFVPVGPRPDPTRRRG